MFGMLLRDSQYQGAATFDMALAMAEEARGADKTGQRTEFAEPGADGAGARGADAGAGAGGRCGAGRAACSVPAGRGWRGRARREPREADGYMMGVSKDGRPCPFGVVAPGPVAALQLELPKPMFVGTPKNIVSDNLDPRTGKAAAAADGSRGDAQAVGRGDGYGER